MNDAAIDAGVRMGHVHLKVADLERAPEPEWPRDARGGLAMYTKALDLRGLLAAGNKEDSGAADDQVVLP
jgi:catechol-2,3-dioxygenase